MRSLVYMAQYCWVTGLVFRVVCCCVCCHSVWAQWVTQVSAPSQRLRTLGLIRNNFKFWVWVFSAVFGTRRRLISHAETFCQEKYCFLLWHSPLLWSRWCALCYGLHCSTSLATLLQNQTVWEGDCDSNAREKRAFFRPTWLSGGLKYPLPSGAPWTCFLMWGWIQLWLLCILRSLGTGER